MPVYKIPFRSPQHNRCHPLDKKKTDFHFLGILGNGYYGEVWEVYDKVTDQNYAVKKITKSKFSNWQNEIALLCQLQQHCQPYILCYEGYFEDKTHAYLLTENLSRYQNLTELIPLMKPPEIRISMDLVINLVEGLITLHLQDVIHRDIKPDNILTQGDHIKYIDFGLSCDRIRMCKQSVQGTPNYMAPEMYRILTTSKAVPLYMFKLFDIWSLGATVYELCVGKPPLQAIDYLKLAGKTEEELRTMAYTKIVATQLMSFGRHFTFPSNIEPMKTYDQIIIKFDTELRAYSQRTIGRQISIVSMLQADPSKRSFYA